MGLYLPCLACIDRHPDIGTGCLLLIAVMPFHPILLVVKASDPVLLYGIDKAATCGWTEIKCSVLDFAFCSALRAPQHAHSCLLESLLPYLPSLGAKTHTALIRRASVQFQSSVTLHQLRMALTQLLILACACAGQWPDQGGPVVAPDHASLPARKPPSPGVQQLLPQFSGPSCGDAERAAALPHSLHSLRGGRLGRQLPVQPSAFCGRLRCAAQGLPSCISQAMHWS